MNYTFLKHSPGKEASQFGISQEGQLLISGIVCQCIFPPEVLSCLWAQLFLVSSFPLIHRLKKELPVLLLLQATLAWVLVPKRGDPPHTYVFPLEIKACQWGRPSSCHLLAPQDGCRGKKTCRRIYTLPSHFWFPLLSLLPAQFVTTPPYSFSLVPPLLLPPPLLSDLSSVADAATCCLIVYWSC